MNIGIGKAIIVTDAPFIAIARLHLYPPRLDIGVNSGGERGIGEHIVIGQVGGQHLRHFDIGRDLPFARMGGRRDHYCADCDDEGLAHHASSIP